MNALILYIIKSTVCLSVLYAFYRLLLAKDTKFRLVRCYLLATIAISLLLPLNSYSIKLPDHTAAIKKEIPSAHQQKTETVKSSVSNAVQQSLPVVKSEVSAIEWNKWLMTVYGLVALLLLTRILVNIFMIYRIYKLSQKEKSNPATLIYNKDISSSFSFFQWIFINPDIIKEEGNKIIAHEKIHVGQLHSFDIVLMECMAALMWFNPLVWMMKNSFHLVHEYLADEGVLKSGVDRIQYQTVLVNQVAEGKLISLSSSFNSLVKNRIIMMMQDKMSRWTNVKISALIPIGAILFVAISCLNNTDYSKATTAIAPTKMNVMYSGIINPIKIAVSGIDNDNITVSVDNGKIKGKKGVYEIIPAHPGIAIVSVYKNDKVIQKQEFRVKKIPDPLPWIGERKDYEKGGKYFENKISDVEDILKDGRIYTDLPNFDFEVPFKIIRFAIALDDSKYIKDMLIHSDGRFYDNKTAIKILKMAKKGDLISFEDITCIGPDSIERNIGGILFELK
jgi:hypothetical protein